MGLGRFWVYLGLAVVLGFYVLAVVSYFSSVGFERVDSVGFDVLRPVSVSWRCGGGGLELYVYKSFVGYRDKHVDVVVEEGGRVVYRWGGDMRAGEVVRLYAGVGCGVVRVYWGGGVVYEEQVCCG